MRVMVAKFELTKNPVFLWEAIQAITAPHLDGAALVLPSALRTYLQRASSGIVTAGICAPSDFQPSALKSLGFSDGKKHVAKSYARDQAVGILLSIYDEMYCRKKSKAAVEFMADALGIDEKTMSTHLTAARSFDTRLRKLLGHAPRKGVELPTGHEDVPEVVLENHLRGLPDRFWRDGKRLSSRAPRKVRQSLKT